MGAARPSELNFSQCEGLSFGPSFIYSLSGLLRGCPEGTAANKTQSPPPRTLEGGVRLAISSSKGAAPGQGHPPPSWLTGWGVPWGWERTGLPLNPIGLHCRLSPTMATITLNVPKVQSVTTAPIYLGYVSKNPKFQNLKQMSLTASCSQGRHKNLREN